jgi:Ala-tRNA(Pro) deacylase
MNAESSVFDCVCQLLDARGVVYDILRHVPVYTSQEAAAVRGTSLASGAKALICKADERFVMFVMPADRKLDSKQVRKAFGVKSLRFATREEVLERTRLAPGAIPPFGQLFELPTYCDEQLANQPRINFNAGDHSASVSMAYADYLLVERPTLGTFAVLEAPG